ncbi:hypothetical protein F4780DRAFT_778100 [Xylariomycetidae sp. FL0641]|nr:hypothetical protein F4780DRAFT_778100 [Xylariomycetidae sp. FL0641]
MPTRHRNGALCRAIPKQPVSLIAAVYDNDGSIRQHTICGPPPSSSSSSSSSSSYSPYNTLPDEEGIYVLLANRALQLAAPPCDRRRCLTTAACTCARDDDDDDDDDDDPESHDFFSNIYDDDDEDQRPFSFFHRFGFSSRPPCDDCLARWLRLHEAADAARRHGFRALAAPRPLRRTRVLGASSTADWHFDAAWPARSTRHSRASSPAAGCPPRVLAWMREAWMAFVARGAHRLGAGDVIALDSDDDEEEEESEEEEEDDKEQGSEEGFDTVNDLIEEEFPRLQHAVATCPLAVVGAEKRKRDAGVDEFDTLDDIIAEDFPRLKRAAIITRPSASSEKRKREADNADDDDDDEGYDTFDDLIQEEFPQLQRARAPPALPSSCRDEGYFSREASAAYDHESDEDDTPPCVIIPRADVAGRLVLAH